MAASMKIPGAVDFTEIGGSEGKQMVWPRVQKPCLYSLYKAGPQDMWAQRKGSLQL
jgi:hypothetical protein